jgi:hypothetical protein
MPGTETLGKLFFKLFLEIWQPELAAAEKQPDETNTVEQERLSSQGVPSRACLRGGA